MSASTPVQDHPYLFDDFLDSGLAEQNSPFLTRPARRWAYNLDLKASLLAAFLLALAFPLSFHGSGGPLANLLLLFVYFFAGVPALIDSVEDLLDLEINIDVLMTLAAFSSVLIGSEMEGALLLVLFAISGGMEHTVNQKAQGALAHLKRLAPSSTWVIKEDGTLIQKAVRDIRPDTRILIKAGEVIPLDGVILEGRSSVNLVHLTGESLPVSVGEGEDVAAGSYNLDGALTVKVKNASTDSTLARIIRLITQAQEARPKLQQWFERFSKTYATSIIALAALVALSLPWLLQLPFFGPGGSLYRALSFLIAASPCALILAIPITYLSAVSVCARQGILLKGGITLDGLANCSIFAFDKTGTLTTGELSCLGVEGIGGSETSDEVLAVAAALERNAVHPIAQAVMHMAEEKGLDLPSLMDFRAIPGMGLEALTPSKEATAIGRPAFIVDKLGPALRGDFEARAEEIRQAGELVAGLVIGQKAYILRFRDTPRQGVADTLQSLREHYSMRLLMLTGDHATSAKTVAEEMGIDEYYADLRPEDKLDQITNLSKDMGLVMIGDGINDAPALARATIGIAMGQVGSATAMDASDIILLHDHIHLLDWLMGKARATQRIVRQNLCLALAAIFVASSAALLGAIPLWLAVIMHEGGTVLVGLNGLRLLRK